MHSVYATHVKTYVNPVRNICEAHVKQIVSIVRKEKFKRNINNTRTITQIHFVAFMFALVHVLAAFMSCVYARRKIKPYFARIRSYVNINQKNAAVNGKVWICREYTFCLRT